MRLLLGGYFGCGNLGDDAILLGLLEGLAGSQCKVTVLSGAPEETSRLYGVRSIQRKNFALVRDEITAHDALVYGGGSLFQDATSVRSVMYYASLVRWAKKSRKKAILVGQGVGPLRTFIGKRLTSSAFNMADAVAVRDAASATLLREVGVRAAPTLAADPAFLMPKLKRDEGVGGFQIGEMRTIGIAPRPWGKRAEVSVVPLIAGFLKMAFQSNVMPVLVEMDRAEDGPLIREIESQSGGKAPSIQRVPTPMAMQERLARMDAVVAVRLHAGVLATAAGVPSLMLSYDPKVAAFAKAFDLPYLANPKQMTPQHLFEAFQALMKDRDKIAARLVGKLDEARQSARQNIAVIERCLGD